MVRDTDSKTILTEMPRPANRKGLVIFFIAVFVATIFWLLRSFDQTYQAKIHFPISYLYSPDGLTLKKPLPDHLEVHYESTGWDIMKFKRFKRKKSIVLNLTQFAEQKSIKTSNLLISHLPEEIANIKFLLVSPEVLIMDFEKLIIKEVPIIHNLDIHFNSQYGLSGPVQIEPQTVVISGPESEVNKIQEIRTKFRDYKQLEAEINDQISLVDLSSKNIIYSQKLLNLKIPVEQLSEGSLIIPISIPAGVRDTISLIPEKVTIKFHAAVSVFNSVSHFDFEPYIKLEDFNNASDEKIKVYCKLKEEYIYRVSIDPEYVDYIVIK